MSRLTRREMLAVVIGATVNSMAGHAACAAEAWVDRRAYGPLQCAAAFPLGPLEDLFRELSRLELELQRTLAVPPARDKIDIYLLADEASYRRVIHEQFPRAPYRRALYVRRGSHGAVYAYKHADLAVDLRHECTHALLHSNLPSLPLWLDEGLAEYFEMPEADRAYNHPNLAVLRWNLLLGNLQSLESLEACREVDQMGAAEYRYAWAWVHFMLHGPLPVHRALVDYLAAVRQGTRPAALSERLREVAPELDERIVRHFQHWRKG